MPTLDYHQTLDMVEAFMEASGIRAYCTNICKGRCCENCYTSKNACHKHEGRRISCSAYICYFKTKTRGKDYLEPFKEARSIISREAERSFDKYKTGFANRYFHPPPKRMFKEFMIQGWPPSWSNYDDNKTCVALVKTGLSLEYAARIKVMMNKIIRLARSIAGSEIQQNPRLGQFEAKRVRRIGKLEWVVRHWETKKWV